MHRLKLNFICPTLGVHFKTAALIEVDCQLSVLFCFYRNPDFCVSSPHIPGDYLSFLFRNFKLQCSVKKQLRVVSHTFICMLYSLYQRVANITTLKGG